MKIPDIFLEILQTNPKDISMDNIPKITGIYERQCKICNSKHRPLIDYLLSNVSVRRIADYVNEYQLFNPVITHQSIHNHKTKHTLKSTKALVSNTSKDKKRQAAIELLKDMSLAERLALIEESAFADVATGEKKPTVYEGLTAARLRKELNNERGRQSVLEGLFKSAQEAKDLKLGKGVKKKQTIKVIPVEGVEFSQSVESEID